jgi:hypothetical protein
VTGWTVLVGCGKTTLARENFEGRTYGTTAEHSRRMLKKARLLTRPTPVRQDAPFREQGRRRIETGGGTDRTSWGRSPV